MISRKGELPDPIWFTELEESELYQNSPYYTAIIRVMNDYIHNYTIRTIEMITTLRYTDSLFDDMFLKDISKKYFIDIKPILIGIRDSSKLLKDGISILMSVGKTERVIAHTNKIYDDAIEAIEFVSLSNTDYNQYADVIRRLFGQHKKN